MQEQHRNRMDQLQTRFDLERKNMQEQLQYSDTQVHSLQKEIHLYKEKVELARTERFAEMQSVLGLLCHLQNFI